MFIYVIVSNILHSLFFDGGCYQLLLQLSFMWQTRKHFAMLIIKVDSNDKEVLYTTVSHGLLKYTAGCPEF